MPDEGSFPLGSPGGLSPGTPRMSLPQTPASAHRPLGWRRMATEDTTFTENLDGYACGNPSHTTSPLSDKTWEQYEDRFSHVDTKFVKTWDKDLDTLLLFAALFSAVLTAFVIESYQYMKPESSKTEVILRQILITLQSNGTPLANVHTLEVEAQASSVSTFVRINVLWFASLVTSVSTAFLAMLSKEWLADLHEGRDDTSSETHMRGRQIQLRYDSMRDWRLSLVLPFLPFLLHVSLLLFFAGLVDFLWYFNKTVGIVAAIFVSGMVFIYVWTHIRSIFSATCPYRTSLTFLILIFVNSIRKRLSLDLPAALARAWVFVAVVAEEYWTYNRDAELFRAIWDVLIASWFGRRWRRLLTTLGDTHILPKNLWNLWARHIALGPTNIVRLREEAYISDHPDLMDARVLARMIGAYPNVGDSAQLARELCDFPALVRYRALFIDAGAIDLLVHHIFHFHRHSHSDNDLAVKDREMVLHRSGALARLLTEAEANDARTVIFKIQGIPVLWDFRLRRVPKYIRFWYHPEKALIESGLCQTDAPVDCDLDDIVLYSHLLRLQLVVSSSGWYSTQVQHSVKEFFDRLLEPDTIRGLDDDALTALANAAIFIGMRPIKVDRSLAKRKKTEADAESGIATVLDPDDQEREKQAAHASDVLNVLAALMRNRPDMGLPVLRQICWGVWMLSRPIPRSLSGLLVPTVTSLDAVAPVLARLLSPKWERSSLLDAILVLMMCLLRSEPQEQCRDSSEYEDHRKLLQALLERYPHFLKRMRTMFNLNIIAKLTNLLNFDAQTSTAVQEVAESSDWRQEVDSSALLNSLTHVVGISGFIWEFAAPLMQEVELSPKTESSSDSDSKSTSLISEDDRTNILSATLDVLRNVCIHLGRIKPTKEQDIKDLYILVLSFACRAAAIHFQGPASDPSLTPINEDVDKADVAVSLAVRDDRKQTCFLATESRPGNCSAPELATQTEQALRAATSVIKGAKDVEKDELSLKIINTLLVAIAMLQREPAKIGDEQCGRLAVDMLQILRHGNAKHAIDQLAPVLDDEDRKWADEALRVVRGSGSTDQVAAGRSSTDGRDDDRGILRRMGRTVSSATVMKIEKAGSDLRALVRTPREALSRSERPPRASQTTDRDIDELPQPIQSHSTEANGEGQRDSA